MQARPAAAAPVISLENVRKRFGSFVAVECANFDIPRGGVLLDAWPVGLRQDDHAAHDRRLRGRHQRADPP